MKEKIEILRADNELMGKEIERKDREILEYIEENKRLKEENEKMRLTLENINRPYTCDYCEKEIPSGDAVYLSYVSFCSEACKDKAFKEEKNDFLRKCRAEIMRLYKTLLKLREIAVFINKGIEGEETPIKTLIGSMLYIFTGECYLLTEEEEFNNDKQI